MATIKIQKLKMEGTAVKAGSASIVENLYDPKTRAVVHPVRESLGKILWIADDHRSGIFLSKTRGVVEYDLDTDSFSEVEPGDPRLPKSIEPAIYVATSFGDCFLFLKILQDSHLLDVIRCAFPILKDRESVIAHITHGVLRNGSHRTCDNYFVSSAMSHLFTKIHIGSLKADSPFFKMMGNNDSKQAFFKAYAAAMRSVYPNFGLSTYVDSTPIPTEAKSNYLAALCSHGTGHVCEQMRLVMVLDQMLGLPVWYETIPGNVLDLSTISKIKEQVKANIDVDVISYVLDAGYAVCDLFQEYNIDTYQSWQQNGQTVDNSMVVRMPRKKGYPFDELYAEVKGHFGDTRFKFVAKEHSYYGERRLIEIFGKREYAYIYVDKYNAMHLGNKWINDNRTDYEKMNETEREWLDVKHGFFILISNKAATPEEMLRSYFGRTDIESFFKTGKDRFDSLDSGKWTTQTAKGKMLTDMIGLIAYNALETVAIKANVSVRDLLGLASGTEATAMKNGKLIISTPNKQVKMIAETTGHMIPGSIDVNEWRKEVMDGILMPETNGKKKRGRKPGSKNKPKA